MSYGSISRVSPMLAKVANIYSGAIPPFIRESNIKNPVKIASGSSGSVYKGINDKGEEVAYKIFGKDGDSSLERATDLNFVLEASMYKYVGNRNPGVCEVREIGEGYISMTLAKGDLFSEMNAGEYSPRSVDRETRSGPKPKQSRVYPLDSCLENMAQLLAAVELLHREHVGHFDIRPKNILRGERGNLMFCNLGSACVIPDPWIEKFKHAKDSFSRGERLNISTLANISTSRTKEYSAPETYIKNRRGAALTLMYPAADIWSLGILFFELLTGYNFFDIVVREDANGNASAYIGSYILSRNTFMTRFTKDMNREGFSIYNKHWKREFAGIDEEEMSNISPYKLILREQGNKEDKRLALVWGLINRMLDPNPLTRITASECLRSPLFVKDARASRIISYFQEKYNARTRATRRPEIISLGNTSRLHRDIVKMRTLSISSVDAYAFLKKDPTFAERVERMVRVVDRKIGDMLHMERVSEVHKEIINFCIMVLASYAEYPSKNNNRPVFEMNHMMRYPNQLENMRRRFMEHYSGDISFLKKMVYTMTYFLLVEVFEFDLWL